MSTDTALFDCEEIRGTFRQWQAEQEPLGSQLSESIAALSAYQSHLDSWQKQLGREREELAAERSQLDRDRAAVENNCTQAVEVTAELNASREKVSSLTTALLARTEELRALDSLRAEAITELEFGRARERDLKTSLEELRQSRETEQLQWADELRHMRELLERSKVATDAAAHSNSVDNSQTAAPPTSNAKRDGNSAVLGSIVEQFGKLRQQRAMDRPALIKSR